MERYLHIQCTISKIHFQAVFAIVANGDKQTNLPTDCSVGRLLYVIVRQRQELLAALDSSLSCYPQKREIILPNNSGLS